MAEFFLRLGVLITLVKDGYYHTPDKGISLESMLSPLISALYLSPSMKPYQASQVCTTYVYEWLGLPRQVSLDASDPWFTRPRSSP